jgi:protein SCO1
MFLRSTVDQCGSADATESCFGAASPHRHRDPRRLRRWRPGFRSAGSGGGSLLVAAVLLVAPVVLASPRVASAQQNDKSGVVYVCPMHPDVKSNSPGTCPKCGMTLKAVTPQSRSNSNAPVSAEDGTGDMKIPDTPVFDQTGKQLRFYTDLVRGKTVAIEFIFTTCTTICPPLTATLRKVQQELGDRVGRDIELISVTVDPANDTPDRMKEFSARFGAGPGWAFVTGSESDITSLLKALGGYVDDRNEHSPMILIGNDQAGYWTRTYGLAPASKLVQLINEAAAKPARAAAQPTGGSAATLTPAQAAAHYFPDNELITQDNKPVHFFGDLVRGKVVLINFMFTTCNGICPSMTANLVKVQEYLGDHVGRDVNIISITVDPETDTPEALKKYADQYKVREPGWYFLTGPKQIVDWVLYKLGGYVEDKNDHTTLIVLGNPETGQWAKMFAMSRPEQIATTILNMIPPDPANAAKTEAPQSHH